METRSFTFNPFMENTYLLIDEKSKECVIIDPGCYEATERDELKKVIADEGLKPVRLIQTHCHIDHVLGTNFVSTEFDLKPEMHENELVLMKGVKEYAPVYGFRFEEPADPEHFIKEGDQISFGGTELQVLLVPGHAPGHIVLYDEPGKQLIGGDVLFQGGIGRTDFPHCDHDALIKGIKEKLFALPDDVTVFPGHGPTTTIGQERSMNPFVGG